MVIVCAVTDPRNCEMGKISVNGISQSLTLASYEVHAYAML